MVVVNSNTKKFPKGFTYPKFHQSKWPIPLLPFFFRGGGGGCYLFKICIIVFWPILCMHHVLCTHWTFNIHIYSDYVSPFNSLNIQSFYNWLLKSDLLCQHGKCTWRMVNVLLSLLFIWSYNRSFILVWGFIDFGPISSEANRMIWG